MSDTPHDSSNRMISGVSLPRNIATVSRIVAAAQGISRSELIRNLLTEYLERHYPTLLNAEDPLAALENSSHLIQERKP